MDEEIGVYIDLYFINNITHFNYHTQRRVRPTC